ncbi:MAG: hypothetical protein LBL21_01610 [Rickettsiales bacterium]|jgi:hypothetical protein|nr:hypothetical protein [Rickettsiales bacterium]
MPHIFPGTRISIRNEDWFAESKPVDGAKNLVALIARNLIAMPDSKEVAFEYHLYNESSEYGFSECAYLGDLPFIGGDGEKFIEINHSVLARPDSFKDSAHPEWDDMPLAKLAELLISGKPNPLERYLVRNKVFAFVRLPDAPVPPEYMGDALHVLRAYGTLTMVWMLGDDANRDLAKLARMVDKENKMEKQPPSEDALELANIIDKNKVH